MPLRCCQMPDSLTAPVDTTTEKVAIMRPMMVEKDRNNTWGGGGLAASNREWGGRGEMCEGGAGGTAGGECRDEGDVEEVSGHPRTCTGSCMPEVPQSTQAASSMAAAGQGGHRTVLPVRRGEQQASSCSRCWPEAAAAYLVCEQALEPVVPH